MAQLGPAEALLQDCSAAETGLCRARLQDPGHSQFESCSRLGPGPRTNPTRPRQTVEDSSMSKLRVGVAGRCGSGKTALSKRSAAAAAARCSWHGHQRHLHPGDGQFLTRAGALEPERIRGGNAGCPNTAHPEGLLDNRRVEELEQPIFQIEHLVLVKSGGDNLGGQLQARTGDLAKIYVIDVALEKKSRLGRSWHTPLRPVGDQQIDLASMVGAQPEVMQRGTRAHAWRSPGASPTCAVGERGLTHVEAFLCAKLPKIHP